MIVKKKDSGIPVSKQCSILKISRSSLYYTPCEKYSDYDITLMHKIDEIFTEFSECGYRRIYVKLKKLGFIIGKDRTLKFMRNMGICAIYPSKKTTYRNKEHKVYPYLLRNLKIIKPNQVWVADITYIRLSKGFCFLVAIMDIFSRKILSYRLSSTLDSQFCIDALNEALSKYPAPEIFNTDQGCQFTSNEFTEILKNNNIKISMNSKGRAIDNIFIERFFRTLKQEDIYYKNYISMDALKFGLQAFFHKYNFTREHSSLNYLTPDEVFFGSEEVIQAIIKKDQIA